MKSGGEIIIPGQETPPTGEIVLPTIEKPEPVEANRAVQEVFADEIRALKAQKRAVELYFERRKRENEHLASELKKINTQLDELALPAEDAETQADRELIKDRLSAQAGQLMSSQMALEPIMSAFEKSLAEIEDTLASFSAERFTLDRPKDN